MLRLEALRTFIAVVDAGNIREAGRQLCRTPSAVSMTLRQLEDSLGAALFEGDRKHQLTALGQFVERIGRRVLGDYDQAMETISAYAQGRAGRLRLASVPSVAAHLLPGPLAGFLASRPDLSLSLVDTDSAAVRGLIQSGEADLGFCGQPPEGTALRFTPLFQDQFFLVCRQDNPVSQKRCIAGTDLRDQTLIGNEASAGLSEPDLRPRLDAASLRIRNVTSLLAMVSAGMGVTLLPALATRRLPEGLVAVALAGQHSHRIVGLIERPGPVVSPALTAFRDHVLTAIPQLLEASDMPAVPVYPGSAETASRASRTAGRRRPKPRAI